LPEILARYAAVDIGSNSVLLLAVESNRDGKVQVLIDTKKSLRLAEGMSGGGRLRDSAVDRLLSVLEAFSDSLEQLRVDSVTVCATQLFRIADNGQEVARELGKRFDWTVSVISGMEEARLSYLAAATGLKEASEQRTVVDVGGGSTEVVHGVSEKIEFRRSFPIGAVALSEEFNLVDVVSASALEDARRSVLSFLNGEPALDELRGQYLVVVGGTAMTLGAIYRSEKEFNPERLHGVKLRKDWLARISLKLAEMEQEEREELMPFDCDRAAIIVGGCLIIETLTQLLDVEEITISNRGLRWGLLRDQFGLSL
jgi:exopolyphosphatase/guanosine-5'-triphosphate,3'-diphosphate pyrophosphatase